MSAESLAHPQPGEIVRDNGFVLLPEHTSNVRETFQYENLTHRSTKYNSPGVDPDNPYNAFARPPEDEWVGEAQESEPDAPEQEKHPTTEVLEGVVSEIDILTAKNQEQEERIAELEKQLADLSETSKELLRHKEEQEIEKAKDEELKIETDSLQEEEPEPVPDEDEEKPEDDTPEVDEPKPEIELDLGNYPELYARRKNLASGEQGQALLEAEGKKVAVSMSEYVSAKLGDFLEQNPEATEAEIRAAKIQFYIDARNTLGKEIFDHVDGKKVEGQEAKGFKGALRRFGAWMDRHGAKIKGGLLIVGGIGLVATGIGAATGALTIGFGLGIGTAIGAAKGATLGALFQRHGSKNSAAREISLESNTEFQEMISQLDPENRETFDTISNWLIQRFDAAADKDHSANVKKTTTAAVVGGALGALAGSIQIETPSAKNITTTETAPNAAPEVISHQIAPGELSGQVLDKLFADNGVDLAQFLQTHNLNGYGDSFTLPDGSTNIPLIHAVENAYGSSFGTIGQTHSFAGADALSDTGIRSIFEAIHSNVDWGSTTTSTVTAVTGSQLNVPWTIVAAGSATLVSDSATKAVADRIGRRKDTQAPVQRQTENIRQGESNV